MNILPYTGVQILSVLLLVIFVYDFAISFREAMDLRYALEQLAEINAEKSRLLRKRFDVISAVAKEDIEELTEDIREILDYKIEELKWKFEAMKNTREYKRIRNIVKRNPLKASGRYIDVLQQMKDDIKEQIREKIKKS